LCLPPEGPDLPDPDGLEQRGRADRERKVLWRSTPKGCETTHERNRKNYAANREACRKYRLAYRAANREVLNEKSRVRYRKSAEAITASAPTRWRSPSLASSTRCWV
jgi:hypothetical protein